MGEAITRAVLLSRRPDRGLGAIAEHTPAFLIPLAGKSLADRTAGRLADLGIRSVSVLISDDADRAMAFFNDGARWGLQIDISDVRTTEQMLARLRRINQEEAILLGDLYRLPVLEKDLLRACESSGQSTVLRNDDGSHTGWALLPKGTLNGPAVRSMDDLFHELNDAGSTRSLPGTVLSCLSAGDILASTNALLAGEVAHQIIPGGSADPHLWIGAGTVIHPQADLRPPVWIGENCRIEAGVILGPNTCVADGCVLRKNAAATNSCILPGTIIGSELELDQALVDRNYLAYADTNRTVAIPDGFLLGSNTHVHPVAFAGQLLGRLIALILLLPSVPFTAAIWFIGRLSNGESPLEKAHCLRLPASSDPMLWKTFTHRRWKSGIQPVWRGIAQSDSARILLALPEIAFGRLHWVGLLPRTPEQVEALPEDWRMLYLNTKPGLFQLADVDQCRLNDSSIEQQYSSEVYYASFRGFRQDLTILLKSLLCGRRGRPPARKPVVLSLSTDSRTLDALHEFLNHEVVWPDFSSTRRAEIITAVHEAATNIIRHAYGFREDRPLHVHARADEEHVWIDFYDKGIPFDPDTIAPPAFSIEAEGGFGWYLINRIADHIRIERFNDWNHLSMLFGKNEKGDAER